jgi:uncharacterized protein (TIGR03086 family)
VDQIELIEKASAEAEKVVSNVKVDQLDNATPCAEFDLRGLLNHLIGAMTIQAEAAETGKAALPGPDADFIGDDPAQAVKDARDRLVAAWTKPGVLDKSLDLPWGQFPASMYAGMVFTESIVHGWDVAQATGQDFDPDPELAEAALAYLTPIDGMLRQPQVYAERIEVSADAPVIERLIAFTGRKPL